MSETKDRIMKAAAVFVVGIYLLGVFGFLPGENPYANLFVRLLWPYVALLEFTGAA
jgi:hypothetical protein